MAVFASRSVLEVRVERILFIAHWESLVRGLKGLT